MTIGLAHLRDERKVERLHWMLLLPFVGRLGDYPVKRRGRDLLGKSPKSGDSGR